MLANIELQKPQQVIGLPGGICFADFGKAAFGRLELIVNCRTACTAEISIGEVVTADSRVEREPGGYRCIKVMSKELTAGENRFFMDIPKHRSPYQKTLSGKTPTSQGCLLRKISAGRSLLSDRRK